MGQRALMRRYEKLMQKAAEEVQSLRELLVLKEEGISCACANCRTRVQKVRRFGKQSDALMPPMLMSEAFHPNRSVDVTTALSRFSSFYYRVQKMKVLVQWAVDAGQMRGWSKELTRKRPGGFLRMVEHLVHRDKDVAAG